VAQCQRTKKKTKGLRGEKRGREGLKKRKNFTRVGKGRVPWIIRFKMKLRAAREGGTKKDQDIRRGESKIYH